MSKQDQEQRKKLVFAVTRRMLDVPADAPLEDLKTVLELVGIDVEAAVTRTAQFVKDYPKQLIEEAKARQEAEQKAFERFQEQLSEMDAGQLKSQILAILEQLPPGTVPQIRAHYRELSEVTGYDVKSELLDLLWQLEKVRVRSN